jgi:hypothetical protein
MKKEGSKMGENKLLGNTWIEYHAKRYWNSQNGLGSYCFGTNLRDSHNPLADRCDCARSDPDR